VIAVRLSFTRDWQFSSLASSISPQLSAFAIKFRLSFDSRAFSIDIKLILTRSPFLSHLSSQLFPMAMSVQIPSSPSDAASVSSSTHPPSPLTPPSISQSPSDVNADSNSATIPPASAGKRKPSRRANTAERRATHNAVERQRRETLNGRFLDLAALLPNLSQIRRPSKSSIVNSSIAHIHASRRYRLIAARELRAVKVEADALRQELNEWRERSGIPRLEEPTRGDGFNMILSGEVEVIIPSTQHEDDQSMEDDCEDDYHSRSSEDVEEVSRATAVNMTQSSQSPISAPSPSSHQFTPNVPPLPVHQNDIAQSHSQQVMSAPQSQVLTQPAYTHQQSHAAPPHHVPTSGPTIVTHHSSVSYENPAMMYDNYRPSQFGYDVPHPYVNGQLPHHILTQLSTEMEQKAPSGWYNSTTGQFTPPNSSGGPSPVNSPFGFSGGFPVAQQPRYVETGVIDRERSVSVGSRGSPIGNYEFAGGAPMDNIPRWREGLVSVAGPNPVAYSLLM